MLKLDEMRARAEEAVTHSANATTAEGRCVNCGLEPVEWGENGLALGVNCCQFGVLAWDNSALAADVQALLADRARIRAVVLDERALAVSAGRTDVVTYLDSVLRRMDE